MDSGVIDVQAIVSEWRASARGAVFAAFREEGQGNFTDALAIRARQKVGAEAINVLMTSTDPRAAALHMHEFAAAESQGLTPPTFDSEDDRDETIEKYARTRAWQLCARRVDPPLAEVQPRWQWWR